MDADLALKAYSPDAVALKQLKRGFAISPAWDALFALGFPHLRIIVTGDETRAGKETAKALAAIDPDVFPHAFPSTVVPRYLRGSADADGAAFTEKEARARLAQTVRPDEQGYAFRCQDVLFLVEALFGTEFTMGALLDALEANTAKQWKMDNQNSTGAAVTAMGFLLPRLGPKPHAAAKARIEKLRKLPKEEYLQTDFDLAFGGVDAYRKVFDGSRPEGFSFASHVNDAAALERLAKEDDSEWALDPWFVFQGGPAVAKGWPAIIGSASAWRHASLATELALMKGPFVAPCMKALLKKKRAAEIAKAWLKAGGKSAPGAAKDRPVAAVERDFEALSADTAKGLTAAKGDVKKEKAVLAKAAARYRALRAELGEPPDEAMVHFFGDDGVAFQKSRKPALQRLPSTDETFQRWLGLLQEL